jgi:hypothetical protein
MPAPQLRRIPKATLYTQDTMTEADWLACNDPLAMLHLLRGVCCDRKLRLFAVACCRAAWPLLTDERCRRALELSEQFADGNASEADLLAANLKLDCSPNTLESTFRLTSVPRYDRPSALLRYGIEDIHHLDQEATQRMENLCLAGIQFPAEAALAVVRNLLGACGPSFARAQADFLRCIFGPLPCPPITVDRTIQARNSGIIRHLAAAIYDNRRFDDLPILADALEEAGCTNSEVLHHCRQPEGHALGCWVLDSLLGK